MLSDAGQDGTAPRRAAVSSHGMSDNNVHAVLEQAPATAPRRSPDKVRSSSGNSARFPKPPFPTPESGC